MLTIVLSGPKSAATQARTALASRGFGVTDNRHDYGLADPEAQPQEFVHVLGDDIDAAHAAVAPLGYRLSLHYATPEASPPSAEQQIAAMFAEYERRIAALERQAQRPPIRGGAVESPGFANQNATYGAEQTRRAVASMLLRGSSIGSIWGGVVGSGDLAISPPGSGMTVNVAPGEAWVPGSSSATQSGYYCRASSSTSLAIAASDPSNPRIDRVSALITDKAYSGSTDTFALAVETGTPTAGATLANLNGAAAAPASSLTLGYVLVPATATNIVSGDIDNIVGLQAFGLPLLFFRSGASSITAAPNQWIEAAAGVTITLPAPTANSLVAITTQSGTSASNPVTVAGSLIHGPGPNLAGATSFVLGEPYISVILLADGTSWEVVSGMPDTGWLTLPLINSATATAGWHTPAYRIIGDTVYLRGNVTTSGSSIGAQLPSGARPGVQVELLTWATTANAAKKVVIDTSGNINLAIAGDAMTLDGLWFSLS